MSNASQDPARQGSVQPQSTKKPGGVTPLPRSAASQPPSSQAQDASTFSFQQLQKRPIDQISGATSADGTSQPAKQARVDDGKGNASPKASGSHTARARTPDGSRATAIVAQPTQSAGQRAPQAPSPVFTGPGLSPAELDRVGDVYQEMADAYHHLARTIEAATAKLQGN
ncbi:hypothetical protein DENSPDRAFT_855173 [Dentipellis sp. KUC8613]|nr:hypothetical protein DENSPDRAFT_855173 [Dentipellis sp. KUC8613]